MAKIYFETPNGIVNSRRNMLILLLKNIIFIFFGVGLITYLLPKPILYVLGDDPKYLFIEVFVKYCKTISNGSFILGSLILFIILLTKIIQFLYFDGNKYNAGKPLIRYRQRKMQKQIKQALIDEGIFNPKVKTPKAIEVGDVISNLDNIQPFIKIEVVGDTFEKLNSISPLINASLRKKFSDFVVSDMDKSSDGRWIIFYLRNSSKSSKWIPSNLYDMVPQTPYILKIMDNMYWDISKNCHGLITGPTGSGKTYMFYGLLIQIFLSGSTVFIADPKVSGLSRLSDFLPKENISSNTEEIVTMISNALMIMKERQKKINEYGKQKNLFDVDFTHFSEMKPIYIIIDEVASLISSFEKEKEKKLFINDLTRLVMMSRSAGICVILLTQQANVQVLGGNSSIRDQLSFRVLLGNSSTQSKIMTFGEGFKYSLTNFKQGSGLFLLNGVNHIPSLIETTNLNALGNDLYTVFNTAYRIGQKL